MTGLDATARLMHARVMSAAATLRAHTATAHDQVDHAFGTLGLHDRTAYAAFLTAHARALPAAEAALAHYPALPAGAPRTPLLAQDLRALGAALPAPIAFAVPDEAAAWGALYVVEGSRLGGAMLAERVPEGLPRAYLGAAHGRGDWRALRGAIDDAAAAHDAAWLERAIAGADACFDLYRRAATG